MSASAKAQPAVQRKDSSADLNEKYTKAYTAGSIVFGRLPELSSTQPRESDASSKESKKRKKPEILMAKAKILSIRYSKGYAVETQVTGPDCYDYYVHFLKLNRRHDRWLPGSEVCPTSDNCKTEAERKRAKLIEAQLPEIDSDDSDHDGMAANDIEEWEKATKIKSIELIQLGPFLIETWYWSPFPDDYQPKFNQDSKLYFCEFCLKFFKESRELSWHRPHCVHRHPPGDEIYRDQSCQPAVSVFEVDGYFEKVYCENICYLAKLFLDHKRFTSFDVGNFFFYVLGEWTDAGFQFVGYFSKEKNFMVNKRNLSCIMSLPCYQRRGYGNFLIEMSYELSKLDRSVGTPERPLSDLGKVAYHRYWARTLVPILDESSESVSLESLSQRTYIQVDDIKQVLQDIGVLRYCRGQYHFVLTEEVAQRYLKRPSSSVVTVKPDLIHYTPLITNEQAVASGGFGMVRRLDTAGGAQDPPSAPPPS